MCRSRSQRRQSRGVNHRCPRSQYRQKTRAVFTVLSENTGSLHCIVRKRGQSSLYCQKTREVFTVLSENAGSPEDLVAEKYVVCRSRGVSLAVCWIIRVPDGSVQRTTSLVSGSPEESQATVRTPGGRQLGSVCTEHRGLSLVRAECAPCKEKKNGR